MWSLFCLPSFPDWQRLPKAERSLFRTNAVSKAEMKGGKLLRRAASTSKLRSSLATLLGHISVQVGRNSGEGADQMISRDASKA